MPAKKEIPLKNQELPYKYTTMTYHYGIVLHYRERDLKIQYQIELKFHNKINADTNLYSVNRKQLCINYQKPEGKLYNMADQMVKNMYPVQLHINKHAKIVQIANHKEIIPRCAAVSKKLQHYYNSPVTQKIIKTFESHYTDAQKIAQQLEKELFYKLLFMPLYKAYDAQFTAQSTIALPFDATTGLIPFLIEQKIEPYYTADDKVSISVKSIEDSGSVTQKQAAFEAQYLLYPENHNIASVTGTIVYGATNETLQFEIYHTNKQQRKPDKIPVLVDASHEISDFNNKTKLHFTVEEPPKIKGFWHFLNNI